MARPLKYQTPKELEKIFNGYFEKTPIEEWTITGLCLSCGLSKQLMNDYQAREEYSEVVTLAKLKVEHSYELSLRKHGRSGDIFALKNFGWQDQREIEHTGPGGGPLVIETNVKFEKASGNGN